jgi:hypothetical protein
MKCPSGLMTGWILGKFFSFSYYPSLSVPIKGMDETKFKETEGLHSGRRSRAPIKGMDEMSVRLDDGTDFGEVFFF